MASEPSQTAVLDEAGAATNDGLGGHEEQFSPPRLSASCGLRKETIAATGETRRLQSFAKIRSR